MDNPGELLYPGIRPLEVRAALQRMTSSSFLYLFRASETSKLQLSMLAIHLFYAPANVHFFCFRRQSKHFTGLILDQMGPMSLHDHYKMYTLALSPSQPRFRRASRLCRLSERCSY